MPFSSDSKPGDSFSVEDVDVFAVGEFDQVIRLVGNEHGVGDDAGIGLRDVVLSGAEVDVQVALTVEFAEGLSELVVGH